ncbi:cell filamentation protein Fic [Listeria monocytogenes]|uniref:protein adenylyltransferase n=1 Tax=Listeria monocytogenes TaxID=1639 RepID=A0AAN3BCN4_LISMN|nr:cell filamentation protein Fic [Listeria monocytogenes]EAC3367793.1 cell filamentation protein Fic [Listeria monocytogenes]EAC7086950.1 cell filamentation protein Fic [Listeria monocytogenes]EAC8542048.1 cell filamentation protein Fic [Listeria monocytogenes]EAC8548050.1 cell filamentation protein Fic [Listeria monocytogenes]
MRKNEYNYVYIDPDSAYTYLGSSVLINKFDIKDRTVLEKKEYEITVNRLFDLTFRPIEVQSMSDIREIHHYLFEELYDWAGQYRKVNISKAGNAFMAMQAFDTGEQYINQLITTYHMTAISKEVIAHDLAVILDNLNHMHPFREGNGRTQRESIRFLID